MEQVSGKTITSFKRVQSFDPFDKGICTGTQGVCLSLIHPPGQVFVLVLVQLYVNLEIDTFYFVCVWSCGRG